MSKPLYLYVLSLSLLFLSCTKTEIEDLGVFDPFANESNAPDNGFGKIVYFDEQEGNIICIDAEAQNTTIITTANVVKDIALSYDKTKIAYVDEQFKVLVMDLQGNVLDEISDPNNISEVEWASDNETIIYRSGYNIKVSGDSSQLVNHTVPFNVFIRSFSVSKYGDLAYSYIVPSTISQYGVAVVKKDGSYINTDFNSETDFVRFSNQNNDYITACNEYSYNGIITINADNTSSFSNVFEYTAINQSICSDKYNRVDYTENGGVLNLILVDYDTFIPLTDFTNDRSYFCFDWKI